jgi:hypothetical protein
MLPCYSESRPWTFSAVQTGKLEKGRGRKHGDISGVPVVLGVVGKSKGKNAGVVGQLKAGGGILMSLREGTMLFSFYGEGVPVCE